MLSDEPKAVEVLSKLAESYNTHIIDYIRIGVDQDLLPVDYFTLQGIAEDLLSQIAGEYYRPLEQRQKNAQLNDDVIDVDF